MKTTEELKNLLYKNETVADAAPDAIAAAQDFCALMKRLNAETGCAILMVTHDPVVAAAAERIHILRDGRFMDSFETQGSPARVAERYLDAMRAE